MAIKDSGSVQERLGCLPNDLHTGARVRENRFTNRPCPIRLGTAVEEAGGERTGVFMFDGGRGRM
jgi:hypothetical protein